MQTKRCDACRGSAKILGLGGIYKDCVTCHGVGHVKIEKEDNEDKTNNKNNSVSIKSLSKKKKYITK